MTSELPMMLEHVLFLLVSRVDPLSFILSCFTRGYQTNARFPPREVPRYQECYDIMGCPEGRAPWQTLEPQHQRARSTLLPVFGATLLTPVPSGFQIKQPVFSPQL